MLALLVFGLLAASLPVSLSQPKGMNSLPLAPVSPKRVPPPVPPQPKASPKVQSRSAPLPSKPVDNAELLAKLNVLGNELERLGSNVNELLQKSKDKGPAVVVANAPKLKVLKASREVALKANKFTVTFKAPEDCPSVSTKWMLTPLNQVGATQLVSRVSSQRQPDGSDLCETSVDVSERGELSLTLVEDNRFEIFLRLDNSKTSALQNRFQNDVPVSEFTVDTPDVVSYKAGEELKLPVVVNNGQGNNAQDNMFLDIQYLTPDEKVLNLVCKPSDPKDFICNSKVSKKYLSSMDVDVTVNTARLKPVGYTRVSSTSSSDTALVPETRLTRVLSIRPAGQVGAYPDGFTLVKAVDNKCSYTEKTCTAKCVAYGNNVDEKSIIIERVLKGDVREQIKELYIGRKVELGQATASTEFTVPQPSEGIRSEPFACKLAGSKDKKKEDIGRVSYKVETRVVQDRSFYEINENQVKVTCTAEGDKEPEVAAVLSMKPSENGRAVELRHKDYKVMEIGPGQVTSVFYYDHNFGQIKLDRVFATCFARSNPKDPYDLDKYVLTEVFYLRKEPPGSLY